MRFGFALPIFANPGVPDFRTPNFEELDWEAVETGVHEAERLGFDSVWVADHLFLGRDGAILEGWTTISALAGLTSNMRLGTIHLGNEFRHPPLVAKMAATLDVVSRGRLEFFVDPGWREREHVAYGLGLATRSSPTCRAVVRGFGPDETTVVRGLRHPPRCPLLLGWGDLRT